MAPTGWQTYVDTNNKNLNKLMSKYCSTVVTGDKCIPVDGYPNKCTKLFAKYDEEKNSACTKWWKS